MKNSNLLALFVTAFVILEIGGFLLIRFGRQYPPPTSSMIMRVGKLAFYSAPVLLILELFGLWLMSLY